MKAFVQREPDAPGVIANINYYAAFWGLRERGYEIELFAFPQLTELELSREVLLVGGIGTVLKAFELLGVEYQALEYVPSELERFAGRRLWQSTLGEVRAMFDGRESAPIFIKPLPHKFKLFGGHVVRSFRDLIATGAHPHDTPVRCAETVPFASEYRCFLHRGEIIGAKHYAGDFRLAPDWSIVEAARQAYQSAPAGCAMDFGVTHDGRTLLVEVNDGFSLGHYGLNPNLYAALLADRWSEITGAV